MCVGDRKPDLKIAWGTPGPGVVIHGEHDVGNPLTTMIFISGNLSVSTRNTIETSNASCNIAVASITDPPWAEKHDQKWHFEDQPK